ncbi:hypothetical protein PG991_012324 [Apiospora marii]|uniref:Uncharacterized protein n=1 Tax=Apiospora marii TaxID=335849 RepID=A0ABR1R9W2_9PEZI
MEAKKGHFVSDVLDDGGDLIIRITDSLGEKYDITYSTSSLVDSRSMIRASDKWANLILNASRCGQACNHRVIAVSGEILAYSTLLFIIHSHFQMVSGSVEDLCDLYYLVVLADELEVLRLLRPWIGTWLKPHQQWYDSLHYMAYTDNDEFDTRQKVAWILGEKELMNQILIRRTRIATLTKDTLTLQVHDAELMGDPDFTRRFLPSMPNISQPRLSAYPELREDEKHSRLCDQKLLETHRQFREELTRGLHCECTAANVHPFAKVACTSEIQNTVARVVTRSLYKNNIGTPPILDSIDDVYCRIMAFKLCYVPGTGPIMHHACNPIVRLRGRLNRVIENIPSPLDEEMETYLDARAKLLGLLP